MQTVVHRTADRGTGDQGAWLTSRFSFSFAHWYEPTRMGFGALRVINDDQVAPHTGFGMHPHQDAEIVTVVTSGAVTHKDSNGNEGRVTAGGIQVMSAGTGVLHSEYNEGDVPFTLFQIWILPKERGVTPAYAERELDLFASAPGIRTFVQPRGGEMPDALGINQDAWISYVSLDESNPVTYGVKRAGNGVYIFVIDGAISVANETLHTRDAIGVTGTPQIALTASTPSRALLFDVPVVS